MGLKQIIIDSKYNYPNSLTANKKALQNARLFFCAPPSVLFSNQFKEDLYRIYELSQFIDIKVEPRVINNHLIYKDYHPLLVLNHTT